MCKTVGKLDMVGHKEVTTSQIYRTKELLSIIHDHNKAAKITGSALPEKSASHRQRWNESLELYYDCFIRY